MRSNGKLAAKWSLVDLDRTSYDAIRSASNHSFWSWSCCSITNFLRFDGLDSLERDPDEGIDR